MRLTTTFPSIESEARVLWLCRPWLGPAVLWPTKERGRKESDSNQPRHPAHGRPPAISLVRTVVSKLVGVVFELESLVHGGVRGLTLGLWEGETGKELGRQKMEQTDVSLGSSPRYR